MSQCQMPAWRHKEVSEGDVPPSEAVKFCIFETGIVQFNEYFWVQIKSRQYLKNMFYGPDWLKFCILGEILVN